MTCATKTSGAERCLRERRLGRCLSSRTAPALPACPPSLAARRGYWPGMASIPGDSKDGGGRAASGAAAETRIAAPGTTSSLPGVVAMIEWLPPGSLRCARLRRGGASKVLLAAALKDGLRPGIAGQTPCHPCGYQRRELALRCPSVGWALIRPPPRLSF
jgi:hypothetical protein